MTTPTDAEEVEAVARRAFELLVVYMSMTDSQGALNCERAVRAAFPGLALDKHREEIGNGIAKERPQ